MELYFVLILAFGALVFAEDAPCEFAVKIHSGVVCGVKKKAANGEHFVSFLGIPYAKAPIGELRFAAPQDPDPFVGVFNATKQGPVCPQAVSSFTNMTPAEMSEDCLRINVHVPLSSLPHQHQVNSSKELLPILTFVHGGSFSSGSGNPDTFGPEYLMTEDVILVTINYRLTSIGFLSLDTKYIPGNAGLRDTIFALQWIQRNILNFGGNRDEVTLGGQSASGAMVHLLALSPAVKGQGLFKRVLAMSGNALANFYSPSPLLAKINAHLFLAGMKISPQQSAKSIHRKLSEASIDDILKAEKFVHKMTGSGLNFCPVIESPHEGVKAVIPKDPEVLLKEGYGKEYPSIITFTNNECEAFKVLFNMIKVNLVKIVQALPTMMVPKYLMFDSSILTLPVLSAKIAEHYFNESHATAEKILAGCTDSIYKYPALRVVDRRLEAGGEPTYVYEFGYNAEQSILKKVMKTEWQGSGHAEDLGYFFRGNMFLGNMTENELNQPNKDSRMKRLMTKIVTNYLKTGNPSTSHVKWSPADKEYRYLSIDGPDVCEDQPASAYLRDLKNFYDSLYKMGRTEIFGPK